MSSKKKNTKDKDQMLKQYGHNEDMHFLLQEIKTWKEEKSKRHPEIFKPKDKLRSKSNAPPAKAEKKHEANPPGYSTRSKTQTQKAPAQSRSATESLNSKSTNHTADPSTRSSKGKSKKRDAHSASPAPPDRKNNRNSAAADYKREGLQEYSATKVKQNLRLEVQIQHLKASERECVDGGDYSCRYKTLGQQAFHGVWPNGLKPMGIQQFFKELQKGLKQKSAQKLDKDRYKEANRRTTEMLRKFRTTERPVVNQQNITIKIERTLTPEPVAITPDKQVKQAKAAPQQVKEQKDARRNAVQQVQQQVKDAREAKLKQRQLLKKIRDWKIGQRARSPQPYKDKDANFPTPADHRGIIRHEWEKQA